MRAALYLRVSTEEQAREGVSLDGQQQALLAYCRSQDWTLADVYRDEGESGKNLNRPAVQRLLEDARAGRFDVVVVWKIDRLSRRQRDLLHVIEEVLEPAKIGFRSATEAFQTDTPGGKAMLGLLGVFAQLERETIIERTRMGLHQVVQSGRWVTGRAPYGYKRTREGMVIDEATAPFVRLVYQMTAEGAGLNPVCAELDRRGAPTPRQAVRWHKHAVWTILNSRAYVGEVKFRGKWLRGNHDPLLPDGLWEAANAVRATRTSRPAPRSLLAGLLFCGVCGEKLRLHRTVVRGKAYPHYECRGKERHNGCTLPALPCAKVDAAVLEGMAHISDDPEALRTALGLRGGAALTALRKEDAALARVEGEAKRNHNFWLQAVQRGDITFDQLRGHLDKIEQDRDRAVARRREIAAELERAAVASGQATENRKRIRAAAAAVRTAPPERQRTILRQVVRRIVVDATGAVSDMALG